MSPKRMFAALLIALLMFQSMRPMAAIEIELYVRGRVVQLEGNGHACTGVQVHLPNGSDYIMSAAHCDVLAENGAIWANVDGQRAIPRRIIESSLTSDLMLLEPMPHLKGITIAKSLHTLERIMALTHGKRLPTHRADGEVLGDFSISAMVSPINSDEDRAACTKKPKQKVEESFFGAICVVALTETMTTVHVDPGSSGGPMVNAAGELVGIVSIGDANFSGISTLGDIKTFIAPY